jgi:hypothetical protein
LAASSFGLLARSDHAFQNFVSCALMPVSPGSASDSSALSRFAARAFQSARFVFCARYCASMNVSRMRRKPTTSTPCPRWAPVWFAEPEVWICCASEAERVAS